MNITPVNTINCTPIKQNNKSNKIAFGSVIPVSVKIDGKMLEQSVENIPKFESLCRRFSIGLNKGKGIFTRMQNLFQKTDKDFNGAIYSIRGSSRNALWGRRKFFITGEDIDTVRNAGRNIGWEDHSQTSKSIYRDNEYELTSNSDRRIPNIENFTIEVKTREVHKKDGTTKIKYDITGGYFTPQTKVKEEVPSKPLEQGITKTKEKIAKTQQQTKPEIQKEEQYQPEFDFVKEIDAEYAEKIRKEKFLEALMG